MSKTTIKNPVYHSKTKHIEIRHHFIRDSYEKRLIEMVKIHTDHNVADLLTKAFDVSRFNFLVASIGKRGWDTKIPQSGGPPIKVGDEAVHKELGDRMERAATTASSLEVEQDSATAGTSANRDVEITATIDGHVKTITEASLRRHLKLEDNGGVTTLPNSEIFEQLALMGDEGTSWIQEKISDDTKVVLEEEEPIELVENQVSTAAANLVYIRRSAQKRKDKGKAIMQESEPPKKVKKRVQVQMSMDKELAKKVFEEEQVKVMAEQEQERINFEAALELQRQLDEREEVAAEPTQA
ncbi:hypothetical protein Tco_0386774 [Tanacetum coccineum]